MYTHLHMTSVTQVPEVPTSGEGVNLTFNQRLQQTFHLFQWSYYVVLPCHGEKSSQDKAYGSMVRSFLSFTPWSPSLRHM